MQNSDYSNRIEGYYSDIVTYKDGTKIQRIYGKDGVVIERPYNDGDKLELSKNLIVNTAGVLMAGLFMGDIDFQSNYGVIYFAFGGGDPAWDLLPDKGKSLENATITQLTDEKIRKLPTSKVYLDAWDGQPTLTKTNFVQLQYEFDGTEVSNEYLREFGLFGGDATAVENSGQLFDYVIMPSFYKDSNISLLQRFFNIKF